MQIPVEFRRRPPDRTLAWVEGLVGPGADVVSVRRFRNAWAAVMHGVDVDHGGERHRLVLRRWARTDIPPDVGVVENEAAALGVLAARDARVDAPRLLGADPAAQHADVPALVMTRVPGRVVLAPRDVDRFVDGLAETLRRIHATPVAEGVLNYYRPWSLDTVLEPPSWSAQPHVWKRAIEIAHQPVPAHEHVFVHHDFHPGNVLWTRGCVTGVVDWTHTCRGPAAADIAHCRLNLALLVGMDAADDFARRYGALPDQAWHDIADAVSVGGEQPPDVWRWHDAGRTDMTADGVIASTDAYLAAAVNRFA